MKLKQYFFNINIYCGQKTLFKKECLEELLNITSKLHWLRDLHLMPFIIYEWTPLNESPDTLFHFLEIYSQQGLEIMQREAYMKIKLK